MCWILATWTGLRDLEIDLATVLWVQIDVYDGFGYSDECLALALEDVGFQLLLLGSSDCIDMMRGNLN